MFSIISSAKTCLLAQRLSSVGLYVRPLRDCASKHSRRTMVYHAVLAKYLDNARERGFSKAQLWACSPEDGQDYVLNKHGGRFGYMPSDRLVTW